MSVSIPVDFEAKVKSAKSASGGGYPIQISAADLMKNFKYAALDAEAGIIKENGDSRMLAIPAPSGSNKILGCEGTTMSWKDDIPAAPATGTHVLGCVDGMLQWIATEEC